MLLIPTEFSATPSRFWGFFSCHIDLRGCFHLFPFFSGVERVCVRKSKDEIGGVRRKGQNTNERFAFPWEEVRNSGF